MSQGVAAEIENIDCGETEYFQPFSFIENDEAGPTGSNVAFIAKGYFVLVFTPDSGRPPGIIAVYDLGNPRAPVEVARISNELTDEFREQHSLPVAIRGGREYVAFKTTVGIQIWDFTDPLTPAYVSRVDLPGVRGGDYDNTVWQTTWQGNTLYVGASNLGIFIVDTSDVAAPRLVNQVPAAKTGGFRVGPLFARGDHLIVSNMDTNVSLGVLDVSRPHEPALLGKIDGLPRLYTTLAFGDRVYGAGRDGVVTIHSIADPTHLEEVASIPIGQDSLYVATQDHFVYSGRQDNFVKIDVSDEQNPAVVGEGTLSREHPDHGQITPFGNLLFVGNDHGTGNALFCHQMGRDTLPLRVAHVDPADGARGVATTSRVTLSLSDYVDTRTVGPETVIVREVGGAALSGVYTYAFNTLSFEPDGGFAPGTEYEIDLPLEGLRDVMGHGLDEARAARFTTIGTRPPSPQGPPGDGGEGEEPLPATGGASSGGPAVADGGEESGGCAVAGAGGRGRASARAWGIVALALGFVSCLRAVRRVRTRGAG